MLFMLLSAVISFILSFGAKILADIFLQERFPILGSFIGLDPSLNSGVAFGITFLGRYQIIVVIIALLLVVIIALRSAVSRLQYVAYGLIIGGAIANIVDRIGDGLVTDFFQVSSFPVFNVSDSCITIGAVLLAWDVLLRGKTGKR